MFNSFYYKLLMEEYFNETSLSIKSNYGFHYARRTDLTHDIRIKYIKGRSNAGEIQIPETDASFDEYEYLIKNNKIACINAKDIKREDETWYYYPILLTIYGRDKILEFCNNDNVSADILDDLMDEFNRKIKFRWNGVFNLKMAKKVAEEARNKRIYGLI